MFKKDVLDMLSIRGVELDDVADIVYRMQSGYNDGLTLDKCLDALDVVLSNREVQHAFLVGIELDMLAEKGLLSEPLLDLIVKDNSLFGVDETIALGGCYSFGFISITTFGHLDKEKIGIIKSLDNKKTGVVNTFLDDLICMLASNASAFIANTWKSKVVN